jgi:small subunit ribosomal protein S8
MSANYLLADMLAKLRNGQKARMSVVKHMKTNLCENVLDALIREGVVSNYSSSSKDLHIELKYSNNEPAITKISCVSRPGRRVYTSVKSLWDVHKGLGFLILSTPKGVLSDKEARRLNVGGEILCKVV